MCEKKPIFIKSAHSLGRFDLVVAMSVRIWLSGQVLVYLSCPLPMQFFLHYVISGHRTPMRKSSDGQLRQKQIAGNGPLKFFFIKKLQVMDLQ